ncbi:MAG: hypothetical protein B7X45_00975 [Lysobacterales bacterium 15-68-25]|jgi:hypothetical protein|nr:MAG: hypothetical protein B7X45_00975 [Xanthomonadales bacterium 15-68-25]
MKRILMLVVAALALAAGSNPACAGGGTIRFSGAVVEPTCAVVAADGLPAGFPAVPPGMQWQTCGRTASDPGRTYARDVRQLDAVAVAGDPLLSYYARYAGAGTPGDPSVRLVVRTYQ